MPRKTVRTDKAPSPVGPYSQAIVSGGFVFCSGQIAIDPETGLLIDQDIESETTRVMVNLKAVLECAGSALEKVVKTTIFLCDLKDFTRMNEVYGSFFEGDPPARSAVQVAALPRGVRVEIECIAEVP
ncbi:MAG: RidA family protein [Candidatus Latescibacter sp.]|nr:RidA family protein [Candidatus Latescibacter sp.]